MTLNNNQIEDFKTLYKKHFGLEINNNEALSQATSLLNLVKLLSHNYKKLGE